MPGPTSPITECVLDVALTWLALPLEPGGGRFWPRKMALARTLSAGGVLQCDTAIGLGNVSLPRVRGMFPCEAMQHLPHVSWAR
jgi:hypothetical protein